MLIKRAAGHYIIASKAAGETITSGAAVAIIGGEVHLADKDLEKVCVGFAKDIQGGNIVIQTSGYINDGRVATEYWLGNNGSLLENVPTSGMVQKVATKLGADKLLIDIDATVILL
jgi:hypothetical protein